MQMPKFLPWAARQAGISEAAAATLWRQASTEAAYFTGESEGAEYANLAVECFLELLDGKPAHAAAEGAAGTAEPCWVATHQTRMAEHFMNSTECLMRSWLAFLPNAGGRQGAAF